MWLQVPNIYNGISPQKHNHGLGPNLHAHSPRRRSESFIQANGNYIRWEGLDIAPMATMATMTGHAMPPPALPINGDRSQGRPWEPTMGAAQDPFLDSRSRRNGIRGSNDTDVSMPDYAATPRSQAPAYHDLPDTNSRVLGPRRPHAPTILPNNDPAFDDLVRMMDSPHRVMSLPSPGLMPPTNTRNNSASNSPPVPLSYTSDGHPQYTSNADRHRFFSAGHPQMGNFLPRASLPRHDSDVTMRSAPRGSDSTGAAPLHLNRSTAALTHAVDGNSGRENTVNGHDSTTATAAQEVPTLTNSASSTTLRASTSPKEAAASTPVFNHATAAEVQKGSGEVKRKRATPRKRGEGPSPRKISKTQASLDVAAVADPTASGEGDAGKGETRVASEGIARSRGRRSVAAATESPSSEGLMS